MECLIVATKLDQFFIKDIIPVEQPDLKKFNPDEVRKRAIIQPAIQPVIQLVNETRKLFRVSCLTPKD